MTVDAKTKPVPAAYYPKHVHVEAGKPYFWCSCGLSRAQPLCDGSHQGTEMRPVKFIPQKSGKVLLCRCKNTKNQPYCDATHIKVFASMHGMKFFMLGALGVVGGYFAYNWYKRVPKIDPKH